ncbi:unnamed protein product [Vitrella brassicaformis CCMP3155]|uniref:PPM-type phosphatase domain-containing protein n=1 Tax=Vitrella brassicaformis (strain CCMP3155) TaxID=1169540 RepID=A0A0G4EP09_VITBC|nr:unnamed protein product [Vitrella brassicaformis CCMP3155]|mmetsp:Transcript_22217/g.63398  ORF Transcript_22217/g.63398 Transcript_22217/m.63398 type:complete len:394 (-) Transcript_22217:130-1311(-)|eukprot:CEL99363.1 unnamed protein product [Vitrella brassicaformis CCMP3155]
MGCTPSANKQPTVANNGTHHRPARRRLSVSHAEPSVPGGDDREEERERGTIGDVSVDSSIFALLPPSSSGEGRRASVFGSPATEQQRGFDNKQMEVCGDALNAKTLAEVGIGYACKKGLKPESPNQDDFFILRVDDWGMYGVFDGHGPSGHDVSGFVHHNLPRILLSDPLFNDNPGQCLKTAFRKVHIALEQRANQPDGFDCALSGTTGTVVIHKDNKLYVAHVGDSRAVLGVKTNNSKKLVAQNLTQDHKPTREDEKKRIVSSGGEVRRLDGDIPHRVFVKGKMYPGLAMSRAIGDTVGSSVGVIPDPDVTEVSLDSSHQFFTVCSDGVWEFISSQEAIDVIAKKARKGVQEATEQLAYEAWRRWVAEEENVVDDITCIVVWLPQPPQQGGN